MYRGVNTDGIVDTCQGFDPAIAVVYVFWSTMFLPAPYSFFSHIVL